MAIGAVGDIGAQKSMWNSSVKHKNRISLMRSSVMVPQITQVIGETNLELIPAILAVCDY